MNAFQLTSRQIENKQTQEILKRKTTAFFVLDLRFYIVNRVTGLNIEGDCFAGESFDEDLHAEEACRTKCR